MFRQVTLVVLAALAACHSYPATGGPYQPSPQLQLLLPQPLPLDARPVLPTGVSPSSNIKTYTQAGLPLPVGGQYVFYYPGVPGSAPFVYAIKKDGNGGEEEGGGWGSPFENLYNFVTGWFGTSTEKPAEETNPSAPEKVEPSTLSEAQGSSTGKPSANLESFDEDEQKEPTSPKPVDPIQPEHKLFLIGQPQFFGNYDALKNPEIIKELGNKNPFPNVLLTSNQQPFVLQTKLTPTTYANPGQAAVGFQKILAASTLKETSEDDKLVPEASTTYSRKIAAGKKKFSQDTDTIVVEALKIAPHAASDGDDDDSEAADAADVDRAEPSVAQVRPQAIALAGPSGVAAAAPVGTAVVGRGGLAVAAPAATAVAGPSGGEPPIVAPANRAAQQAYLAAQGQARYLERAALDDADEYHLNYSA